MSDQNVFEYARPVNEIWRRVGYSRLYEISDRGNVRWASDILPGLRSRPCKPVKAWNDDQGYRRVALTIGGIQKNKLVHCLVAAAFLGPAPVGMEVNHKDGNKNNPSLGNLEYLTHRDNVRHAHATGLATTLRGERHGLSRLVELQVRIIRRCARLEMSNVDIGSVFRIEKTLVSAICTGKRWAHVEGGGGTFRRPMGPKNKGRVQL